MRTFAIICTIFLVFSQNALADVKDDIRNLVTTTVDSVVVIIKDKSIEKVTNHQKIMELLKPMIDYIGFGYKSLGKKKWKALTKKQKKIFIRYFTQRENNFIVDILDKYTDEKINYGKVSILSDTKINMDLIIESKDSKNEVKLFFNYNKKLKRWRAFDIAVEGIARSKTNFTQFNAMVKKLKVNGFLKELKQLAKTSTSSEKQ